MRTFQLVVVGAGPAGWAAAMEGEKLGLDVLLVDRGRRVGGSFVHTGTIPSKILREMALAQLRDQRRALGVQPASRSLGAAKALREGIHGYLPTLERMLASSSIEVCSGSASFVAPMELRISTDDSDVVVRAEKIIIASGSRPRRPEGISYDGAVVCDSDSILQTATVPESLIVLGGGYVGCELACTYAALGSRVTLVDRRRRILRMTDGEISEIVFREMERLGIRLRLGESLGRVHAQHDDGWKATVELRNDTLKADRVLVTLGRTSNTLTLDLEKAGIATDDEGRVKVDEFFRTSAANVYAVGDVTTSAGLVGVSAYQGRSASRHAAGLPVPSAVDLPIVLYTIPETAMIGLTEESCREIGLDYVVGSAPFSAVARTHIAAGDDGLLKLIARRENRRILGVHIAGEQASELIQLATFLMAHGATLETLVDTPFACPTLTELYHVAAMDACSKIA